MFGKVYLICCSIAFAKAAYLGGESISSRRQDDLGNYAFNYGIVDDVGAANERWEAGDAYGNKRGAYSLTDIDGRTRRVEYVADSLGFRAGVKTNEPGTAASVHAAAVIDSPYALPVAPTPISSATLVRPALADSATLARPLPVTSATLVRPLPPATRHLPSAAAPAVRHIPSAAAPAVRPLPPPAPTALRYLPTAPVVLSRFSGVNAGLFSPSSEAKIIRTAPLLADHAPFVPTPGRYAYY